METSKELRQLRHRFIEDTDAPIQVLSSPYFEERIALFDKDFDTQKDYEQYVKQLDAHNGNISLFLEAYHDLRQNIIDAVSNSEAYKEFNADEKLSQEIKNFKPKIGNVNLYIPENAREGSNFFLSLDMKKANFQALRHYNPAILFDAETYDEFIKKFTDMPWATRSKRTRQIIFGQLNPKRTMQLERLILADVEAWVSKNTNVEKYYDLFSINSDEIIYKLKDGANLDEAIKNAVPTSDVIKLNTGIDIRVEFFDLNVFTFKTHENDHQQRVFTKDSPYKREYKCADITYFPQTYKLINGIPINKNDLVFYFQKNETATFLYPLELIDNE